MNITKGISLSSDPNIHDYQIELRYTAKYCYLCKTLNMCSLKASENTAGSLRVE